MASRAIPPKQARSRDTYERILGAVEVLLTGRRFEEISLNDICVAAGVSSSSLYARFPTKASIMGSLVERQQDLLTARLAATLADLQGSELDTWGFAGELFRTYLDWARAQQAVIEAIRADAEGSARLVVVVEEGVRNLTTLIAAHLGATDRTKVRRIELAIRVQAMALAMSASEGANGIEARMEMDDHELIRELTRMAGAYFEADPD